MVPATQFPSNSIPVERTEGGRATGRKLAAAASERGRSNGPLTRTDKVRALHVEVTSAVVVDWSISATPFSQPFSPRCGPEGGPSAQLRRYVLHHGRRIRA